MAELGKLKKSRRFSKWLIWPLTAATIISALVAGGTIAYFSDQETSTGNTSTAWTSTQWTQTSQSDFNNGVLSNVDISTSPGDVLLPPAAATSFSPSGNTGNWTNPANAYVSNNQYATFAASISMLTNSPTANTGSAWTNPANAYADGSSYATITSGTPSGNNIWGTYGFSLTGYDITQVRVRYDAWATPSPITFRAVSAKASGTGAVTPALPAGMAANDIVVLVASTDAGGSISITANGSITTWNALTGSPIDVTGGEKLYVWWGRWSSGTTGPTVTPGGNHCIAATAAWYNVDTSSSPIDVSTTGTETTSDTSFSFATGLTTTVNNTKVLVICTSGEDSNTGQFSGAFTNANLTSISTRINYGTNSGGGGGFGLAEGTLASAGAVGTWAETLANASSKAYICFAFKQATDYPQARVDVSWDGGTSWSSKQTQTLTATETTYWYDVTSATAWTSTKLDNTNFKVRVDAQTVGTNMTVNLDWLPVEVSYTTSMSTWSHTYTTYGIDLTGYLISTVEVGIEAFAASSEKVQIEVTWDGGTNWSSKQTSNPLGSSDPNSVTWFDFTSATSWTPTTLNNTNFKVRIWYYGTGGQVSLDYLPVRVTGRVSSGTIASQVQDTTVAGSSWDGLFWDNTSPSGTGITFEVRASDTPFLKTDSSPSWTSVGSGSPAYSTLTNSPTANTGSAWTNPANAYGDNSSYATITSGNPSGSNVWGTYGFSLAGYNITQVRARYDAWHGTLGSVSSWVSPTSNTANGWTNPTYAYNGNTGDYASISVAGGGTSAYLELYISAISCDKVRVWSGRQGTRISSIDVDVYYNSQWNNIYSGSLVVDSYQEYAIGSTQTVTGMRIRYTSSGSPAQSAYIYEAQFNSIGTASAPQIKVDVSWNGGSSWSSTQNTALTASETTYWYDVTSATTWDATKLNDTNLKVRALAQTVNGDVEVRLDWLPVEVTYSSSSTLGSISITNGTGRYKQWRATLTTSVVANTPTLKEVRAFYYGG